MRLTNVEVRNYRSYVVSQNQKTPDLELGPELNLLVGPNNCGKSNLLRAIALAMRDESDPRGVSFDYENDFPRQLNWAYSVITLKFACQSTPVEQTLLKYLDEYERSAGATTTYAERGEAHLRVAHRPKSGRETTFAVRSKPNKLGNPELLEKCLKQFRKCVRFVYLRSGESLREFLQGTFREILHTVLRENLSDEFDDADRKRRSYLDDLSANLFDPLGRHVLQHLRNVMAEVQGVSIRPFVPPLAETISAGDIWIQDSAETALADKGSGVRGTLLVALLSYLATYTKRSLVLAVEEPESFLHPEAQQVLRGDLARLGRRLDVTLVVSTHSPFLLDRSKNTRITAVRKEPDGRSVIAGQIRGDQSHKAIVRPLFGEFITPTAMEMIEPVRTDKKAVVFVEGYTDWCYLCHAARVHGMTDVTDDIDIRYSEGAARAAVDAILFRQMTQGEVPVAVLLDHDQEGKSARKMLLGKFGFARKLAWTYRRWFGGEPGETPVEAEDLFDQSYVRGFVDSRGEAVVSEKMRFTDGTFHYGFVKDAKSDFAEYVRNTAEAKDMQPWKGVLDTLRELVRA